MKKIIKYFLVVTGTALLLHGIWEYWQCGIFYTMGDISSFEHTRLMASATSGDVGIALVLFIILIFVNKDLEWLTDEWGRKDYVIMILYSLFVSFYFEVNALYEGRWGYSQQMPLFPTTNIGFLPVIQLLILLPLGFYLSRWILKRID